MIHNNYLYLTQLTSFTIIAALVAIENPITSIITSSVELGFIVHSEKLTLPHSLL